MAKYSIVDDESNLIVGTCDDIVGLSGECTLIDGNESFHKIILENFNITQSFSEYCAKTKSRVTNIHLGIMGVDGDPIGSYYFSSKVPLYFRENVPENKERYVELTGTLLTKASKEALEIWEWWRQLPPASTNLWSSLTDHQREGWLEVVRLYFKRNSNKKDEKHGVYSFDSTYVNDSTSFFCALGEAINGPGGYFGFDLLSLEDCLCGGFGAVPPFTLNLENGSDFFETDSVFLTKLKEIFADKQVNIIRL
ncbi:barstar family protein [Paenibacillus flagellatus]|uniref:Barnase inhibitor n=1 Tax=Paenibacillus flagellatus TaxID=2211139 RepID=A0A2V5K9S9_9BACL|nr:barstar family protein [Paenibacillus flagellatus]PYI56315.1 barnase inhibitor [Paenibacillus flagellatus]